MINMKSPEDFIQHQAELIKQSEERIKRAEKMLNIWMFVFRMYSITIILIFHVVIISTVINPLLRGVESVLTPLGILMCLGICGSTKKGWNKYKELKGDG